jgi:hypothetical protein
MIAVVMNVRTKPKTKRELRRFAPLYSFVRIIPIIAEAVFVLMLSKDSHHSSKFIYSNPKPFMASTPLSHQSTLAERSRSLFQLISDCYRYRFHILIIVWIFWFGDRCNITCYNYDLTLSISHIHISLTFYL